MNMFFIMMLFACLCSVSCFGLQQQIADNVQAVMLAAGKSTRFKAKKTKLVHPICGRPMVLWPLKEFESMGMPMTVVLGHQADVVRQEIIDAGVEQVFFVVQNEQRGEGHAVACSRDTWKRDTIMIMYGDNPLITADVLYGFLHEHYAQQATVSFCSTKALNPAGYGRIVSLEQGFSIVEDRDCSQAQKQITDVNAGIYAFEREFLDQYVNRFGVDNSAERVELVDLVRLASEQGFTVVQHIVPFDCTRGVNSLQDLCVAEAIKRQELVRKWMIRGVQFETDKDVFLDADVVIGSGSWIGAGVHVKGQSVVGQDCSIEPYSIIENVTIGDNTTIHSHAVIKNSTILGNLDIDPFSNIQSKTISNL